MAELIHEPTSRVTGEDGTVYRVLVCGERRSDGTWTAWLEFRPLGGEGSGRRTGAETSQPSRETLDYWASGLEPIYLEGAFARARTLLPKPHLLGLRTAIYHVEDLDRAKRWYAAALGVEPYFDEPFYVGFDVGGFELGLDPDTSEAAPGEGGVVVYWGVEDADAALVRLLELGARPRTAVQEVGEGIRVATVTDPFGNVFGVIENPGFQAR